MRRAGETEWVYVSEVSGNQASYDYSLAEKLLWAFAILHGFDEETP